MTGTKESAAVNLNFIRLELARTPEFKVVSVIPVGK
jgi:hypothetical protein